MRQKYHCIVIVHFSFQRPAIRSRLQATVLNQIGPAPICVSLLQVSLYTHFRLPLLRFPLYYLSTSSLLPPLCLTPTHRHCILQLIFNNAVKTYEKRTKWFRHSSSTGNGPLAISQAFPIEEDGLVVTVLPALFLFFRLCTAYRRLTSRQRKQVFGL